MGKPGKTHRLKWDGGRYWCACGLWHFSAVTPPRPGPRVQELHLATVRMAHDAHRRGLVELSGRAQRKARKGTSRDEPQ